MGQLYKKMATDLKLRRHSPRAQKSCLWCARGFVRHFMRAPGNMGIDEIGQFLQVGSTTGKRVAREAWAMATDCESSLSLRLAAHCLRLLSAQLRPSLARALLRFDRPQVEAEQLGQSAIRQNLGSGGAFLRQRHALAGLRDQCFLVDLAQLEEQLGPLVEAGADAVEHGRDVLAHRRPVWTTAREVVKISPASTICFSQAQDSAAR